MTTIYCICSSEGAKGWRFRNFKDGEAAEFSYYFIHYTASMNYVNLIGSVVNRSSTL